jgi:diguanylate cyclase (GGDEF)-like protein
MTNIQNIIIQENISIDINTSIDDAIALMEKNHHGVIVVLSKNIPVAIFTEKDVLHIINNISDYSMPLESILKFNHLITINVKRSVDYALNVLMDNNIRRLIVVNDQNNFLGVVTQDILIKYLEDDMFRKNLIISDLINENSTLISLNKNTTIKDGFEYMDKHNIDSIVLIDDNEEVVGIVTERDSVKIANKHYDLNNKLEDVMTSPIVSIKSNDNIKDVVHLMDEKNIRRVLVVNKTTNKPQAILSIKDIAYNLKGSYGQILETKLKKIKNTLNFIGESIIEIYEDNNEYVIQWINDKAYEHFGNILDKTIDALMDKKFTKQMIEDAKNKACDKKYKLEINKKYFEIICSYHYTNEKESLLLILRDISEFEYALIDADKRSRKLLNELEILQGVIDQQKSMVFVIDGKKIISINKSTLEFFKVNSITELEQNYSNLSESFIKHKNFYSLQDPSSNWIEEIMSLSPNKRIVSILDMNSFEPKAFTVQANPLNNNGGNYVVTLTDITDIKLESQKYHFHATHDALTCIHNRSYYFEKIASEIEQSKRYKTTFSVIMFDIDYFKRFNDTYGHLKGDEVLVRLSRLISEHVRSSDTFARWGGEEFVVLLEKASIDKAELIAEHFRKQIEQMNIKGLPQVTSSFGVTQYKDGDTDTSILKRADDALYEAKEAGRNCVKVK